MYLLRKEGEANNQVKTPRKIECREECDFKTGVPGLYNVEMVNTTF